MIKNQTRYVLQVAYMDPKTRSAMVIAGETKAAALQAVIKGGDVGIGLHMKSIIGNDENPSWQTWYRDDKRCLVLERETKESGRTGSRKREEGFTHAAVVAFQNGTELDIIPGSHRLGGGKDGNHLETETAVDSKHDLTALHLCVNRGLTGAW